MAKTITWVYLIRDQDTGYIKIGWAVNPRKRLREISKEPVLLPRPHSFELVDAWVGDQSDERELHRRFKDRRIRGEWFAVDNKIYDEIYEYFFPRPSFLYGTPRSEVLDRRIGKQLAVCDLNDDSAAMLDYAIEGWGYQF